MRSTLSRLLVAVFTVMIITGALEAQIPGLDIGMTAGVNLATLRGNDVADAKNLVGFMAGLSLVHRLTDRFAIQPEVAYSRKGTKGKFEGDDYEFRLGYIDVPVLAKISLGTGMGPARPALYVGPYAGINLSCDAETDGQTFGCDGADLEVKKFDFGVIGGIGLDFGRLNVFGRYQFGLTSIDEASEFSDAKNRVIQIGGRWSFRSVR